MRGEAGQEYSAPIEVLVVYEKPPSDRTTLRANPATQSIQWKFTRKQARHKFSYIIKRSKH